MDLETENRLAALLLEEARRLRVQADKEGVQAYLQKPNVRHRPNSRFLTATVLGVQQANRVVEVNEMWRAREKELELESKMKDRARDHVHPRGDKRKSDSRNWSSSSRIEQEGRTCAATSSMRDSRYSSSYSDQEDGLKDDEVEEFLHSRVKRGRGAIGSRMDEPGPYLATPSHCQENEPCPDVRVKEEWERRVQGPEKLFLRNKSPDDCWNRTTLDEESPTSELRNKRENRKEKTSEKKERNSGKKKGKNLKKKEKNLDKKKKEKKKSNHHHHHKSRRLD